MSEAIRSLDRQFGAWVVTHFGEALTVSDRTVLQRLAEAVSFAVSIKHTCLDLDVYPHLGETVFMDLLQGVTAADVLRVITPTVKPLVASTTGRRIWLHKYHAFEQAVVHMLEAMQQSHRLEIVTGGPGTGKTWTAAQRIQRELQTNLQCVIKLAAPTGKAANNMMVALANAGFDTAQHALKGLTLHSLLGMNGRSPQPRHHRQQPLACDVLVVDEASMIDLPMMYRLLNAIPSHARLLLLGDKDQLASVEAGSVLADICHRFAEMGCVTRLLESRRYKDSPEIGALAEALNRGDVPDMQQNQCVKAFSLQASTPWQPAWLPQATASYGWIAEALSINADPVDILAQRTRFQLLCALREGPYGTTGINDMVATALGHKPDSWYAGRPVMVTQNDHERRLYNGDMGLVLPVNGRLQACFLVDGRLKCVSQAQMPPHDTCYVITVHKSQGSEYEHVLIVLPAEVEAVHNNPVLTRELVYTAVTRAKSRIDVWAGEGVLQAAAQKTTRRMSGW